MTCATKTRKPETRVSIETSGRELVLYTKAGKREERFPLTRAQAQALLERLTRELQRSPEPVPVSSEDEWQDPEIL